MFSKLNRYGLPVKYAIICLGATVIGLVITAAIGTPIRIGDAFLALAGGALGGGLGGYVRKRRGLTD